MSQNYIEKIAQKYAVNLEPNSEIHSGEIISIRPAYVMTHDNTGAVIPKFRSIDNYLPNWMNQTYSLFVIPSFLTNLLKFGKKGYFNNNGWNYEYNYQTREELQSDLNILLSKIDSFF